jgi:hypothetical protein
MTGNAGAGGLDHPGRGPAGQRQVTVAGVRLVRIRSSRAKPQAASGTEGMLVFVIAAATMNMWNTPPGLKWRGVKPPEHKAEHGK